MLNLPVHFQRSGTLDALVFLDHLSSQQAGRHSLPDVISDMALLSEPEARLLWADLLACPPSLLGHLAVNSDLYFRVGPFFWWLHRLLPVQKGQIASAALRHPRLVEWLSARVGSPVEFVAELPRRLELASRTGVPEIDPEHLVLESLGDKGVLSADDITRAKAARSLVTDPIPNWLLLHKLVTEEQLNEAFREICFLPRASEWRPEEVRRLAPLLPPGFAEEYGCFCLEETKAALRIGLSQIPTSRSIHELYDRLAGCSLFFQSVNHEESKQLRILAKNN